ncbi:hypothetical protein GCM10025784_19280 [Citricoccus nitrophenolicus]
MDGSWTGILRAVAVHLPAANSPVGTEATAEDSRSDWLKGWLVDWVMVNSRLMDPCRSAHRRSTVNSQWRPATAHRHLSPYEYQNEYQNEYQHEPQHLNQHEHGRPRR